MPNFAGLWTARQQLQASSVWPRSPGAPTSVSGTAGNAQSIVSFTAPAYTGYPAGITGYRVTANPGNITATGATSPITITGLTNGTTYAITVSALGASGYGPESSPASVTPLTPQQVEYTTAGTYSFVAPVGISPATVSVVCVGGGGSGGLSRYGGGGAGLGYKNNYAVTGGSSYTVVVGAGGFVAAMSSTGVNGEDSYFVSTGVVRGGQGGGNGGAGTYTGDGGGNGGSSPASGTGYPNWGGGGGAGGYAGNGGNGSVDANSSGSSGNGGGGGGGGGGNGCAGGGGVGLLGQGTSGAGGAAGGSGQGGFGGSGGGNGGYNVGGNYGSGCGQAGGGNSGTGGSGAVRIIFSTTGLSRSFPSTNTGDI